MSEVHVVAYAGTYTGPGNHGLNLGTGTPATVVTLQSLVGELNTVIDLAGGTRAFNLGAETALSTLSGTSITSRPCFPQPCGCLCNQRLCYLLGTLSVGGHSY